MKDNINHPPHYTSHPSGVECITITEHMNFNVGNAIKYLWRLGLKTNPVNRLTGINEQYFEDLKKARWYIDREIQRLQTPACIPKVKAPTGIVSISDLENRN
jgi:hypothetical protein